MIARQPLPARQAEVLAFIREYVRLEHTGPTIQAIGDGLGMKSTSTVAYHLAVLIRKGWLERVGIRHFRFPMDDKPTCPTCGRE